MFVRRVFVPFAAGYFLSQWFRSVNAVVSIDLARELSLDPFAIGLLTSAYFLAFAAGQIPVGLALDRYGARRTESLLLILAALGALLFGAADGVLGLLAGRALIGLGVSACLMASFHAFALSAPPSRLPVLNGAVMTVGALGALSATGPVEWALSFVTWRELFRILSVATIGAALVLYFQAVDPPASETPAARETNGLSRIFASRAFWSVAPLSIAHQGSYLAIQSLWAGPWLTNVAGFERGVAASILLTLAVGMAIGFTGLGYLAGRLDRRGIPPAVVWVGSALLFQGAQLSILLDPVERARTLWFLFGVFGASGMLSYAILTRRFPVAMAGRVNASLNVLVFAGAFAIQAAIGAIINVWSEGSPARDVSVAGHRAAFASSLTLQMLCLLWLLANRRHLGRASEAPPP